FAFLRGIITSSSSLNGLLREVINKIVPQIESSALKCCKSTVKQYQPERQVMNCKQTLRAEIRRSARSWEGLRITAQATGEWEPISTYCPASPLWNDFFKSLCT